MATKISVSKLREKAGEIVRLVSQGEIMLVTEYRTPSILLVPLPKDDDRAEELYNLLIEMVSDGRQDKT